MAEHAVEQIAGPPNKNVGLIQPEKSCIIPPFIESREDFEPAFLHQKLESQEESKNSRIISPTTELRQGSSLRMEEEVKITLNTIGNHENREVPPAPKVSFRTNRDSPTRENRSRESYNGGGILGSVLSAKPKVKRGNKVTRPSVFERLARTETVAFMHQILSSRRQGE